MNTTLLLITILSCLIAVGAVVFLVKKILELRNLENRFKGIVDIDKEIAKVSNDLKNMVLPGLQWVKKSGNYVFP